MITIKRKNKSPLTSSRLHQKRIRIRNLKIAGICFAILLLFAGIVGASHLDFIKIKNTVVEGNAAIDAHDIEAIATSHLTGNYWYLFSKANRFLYQKDQITKEIMATFPRIETARLNVNGNTLLITIKERQPFYTWCAGEPTDHDNSKCYFIDSNGYIFSEAPTFSGNAFFAFYGMIGADHPIGETYLNGEAFKQLDTFLEYLKSKSLHPYALLADEPGSYYIYLEEGGKIIFKKGQEIPVLISNLDIIFKNTDVFSKTGTTTLQYLDLRYGNKLYYKK